MFKIALFLVIMAVIPATSFYFGQPPPPRTGRMCTRTQLRNINANYEGIVSNLKDQHLRAINEVGQAFRRIARRNPFMHTRPDRNGFKLMLLTFAVFPSGRSAPIVFKRLIAYDLIGNMQHVVNYLVMPGRGRYPQIRMISLRAFQQALRACRVTNQGGGAWNRYNLYDSDSDEYDESNEE
ncbi:hypothetical protein Q1695_016003 [Nippostrongylus brasiliensis]|nr:hypothetical protein Q1695_016003 [Nippostrongylus brasiliensis]